MRDGDPDVWGSLYDRFNPDPDGGYARRPSESPLPPEARARLLDAALGIVGSVRVFFEVAEDVLLDQRERLRHVPPRHADNQAPQAEPDGAPSAVQDIPMEQT
jgi:hypothetical protein